MDKEQFGNKIPPITHSVGDDQLSSFLNLHNARYIEESGMFGTKLCAEQMELKYVDKNGTTYAEGWMKKLDYPFYIMFSPDRSFIRIEIYNTLMFPILLEQIVSKGYEVISSGEDMELETLKAKHSTWFGWAHLRKITKDENPML